MERQQPLRVGLAVWLLVRTVGFNVKANEMDGKWQLFQLSPHEKTVLCLAFVQRKVPPLSPYTANNAAGQDEQQANVRDHRPDGTPAGSSGLVDSGAQAAVRAGREAGRQQSKQQDEPRR